jgi:hypothetical protein
LVCPRTSEHVIAVAAGEEAGSALAEDGVISTLARQHIVTGAAHEHVVAVAAEHIRGWQRAFHLIDADRVVAATTGDHDAAYVGDGWSRAWGTGVRRAGF